MKHTQLMLLAGAALAALAPAALAQSYAIHQLDFDDRPAQAWCLDGYGNPAGVVTMLTNNAFRGFVGPGFAGQLVNPSLSDSQTVVFGLNNDGQAVAVSYRVGEIGEHALRFDGVSATLLGNFAPRGIAADGRIVGSRISTFGPGWLGRTACVFTEAGLADLPSLGGNFSQAIAAGPGDWTLGFSFTATARVPRATLWTGGTVRDLGTLGGPSAEALAASPSRYVAGVSDTASGRPHPFRYTLDAAGNVIQRTDLGTLGTGPSESGTAYGVNSAGDVVGTSAGRAFLYRGGTLFDLRSLIVNPGSWQLDTASAINDLGQIVGWGTHRGQPAVFVLTIAPPCDPDLNQDGNSDQGDVAYLINVVAGGDNPTEIDPDFNRDGNVDQGDIDALINVIAGAPC